MRLTCTGGAGSQLSFLPFVRRQYSKRTFLSEDIIASITFFLILLQNMRPKPSISPLAYPQCLARRNAAGRRGPRGPLIYDLDSYFACSPYLVQSWFFSLMQNACIDQLRLLWYITVPAWRIRNRRILHLIDTTSVMYSLCKPSPPRKTTLCSSNLIHLILASLCLNTW